MYDKQIYPVEIRSSTDELVLLIHGHQFRCRMHVDGDTCTFYSNVSRGPFDFKLRSPSFLSELAASGMGGTSGVAASTGDPMAPMPGIIDKILVEEGAQVVQGQALLVMTAMKMEHVIKASKNGTIGKIYANAGNVVKKGEILLTYTIEDKSNK
jgi:3-methylcrotonyl-CoA carboxylase alpha subunit